MYELPTRMVQVVPVPKCQGQRFDGATGGFYPCQLTADVDAPTVQGPWGFFCQACADGVAVPGAGTRLTNQPVAWLEAVATCPVCAECGLEPAECASGCGCSTCEARILEVDS